MGTTAQKLEYLGTTKSQLKDMINYGLPSEQQITSSTTFRNYVTSIFNAFLEALRTPDTLFTNLPKKSGTGAVISLNDTANAPMRITLSPSELSQDATPTPSSQQDIHTISGSNTIKVEGKNLYNSKSTTNVLYTYIGSSSGAISNQQTQPTNFRTIFIKCLPNTTYYIKKFIQTNTIVRWGVSTSDDIPTYGTQLYDTKAGTGGNYAYTYTTISTAKYLVIQITSNSDAGQDYTMQQILDGVEIGYGSTIPTTYTPYTLQEVDIDLGDIEYCKIGNYTDEFIRDSEGNWQLKKNIGKVVLDGTENDWAFNGNNSAVRTEISNIKKASGGGTASGYIKCNYYENVPYNNIYNSLVDYGIEVAYESLGYDYLYIRNKDITSVADFKTWLSTHNTIVYYALATPTYTPITGTLAEQLENIYKNMLSQEGVTNISQINNDLSFNLNVLAIEE